MDEIASINLLRQQHKQNTPSDPLQSAESVEKAEPVKLPKPYKRGTGRLCGTCGEEFKELIIPSLDYVVQLPCKCGRDKIHAERNGRTEAEYRLNVHILREKAQMPLDAKNWTFQTFELREGAQKAFDYAWQYAERFESAGKDGAGLIIFGCTGCGKSHLAASVANSVIKQEHTVRWWTVPELYAEIRGTYHGTGNESEIMKECKNVSLLILDDLGAEKPSDSTRQTINTILNSRISNRRSTIITTNFSLEKLKSEEVIDERTVSRLSDKKRFVWVPNKATDYRRLL